MYTTSIPLITPLWVYTNACNKNVSGWVPETILCSYHNTVYYILPVATVALAVVFTIVGCDNVCWYLYLEYHTMLTENFSSLILLPSDCCSNLLKSIIIFLSVISPPILTLLLSSKGCWMCSIMSVLIRPIVITCQFVILHSVSLIVHRIVYLTCMQLQ